MRGSVLCRVSEDEGIKGLTLFMEVSPTEIVAIHHGDSEPTREEIMEALAEYLICRDEQ